MATQKTPKSRSLNTARIADKLKLKRHRILGRIRQEGQIGRLELARRLRMSNSRLCEIIENLLAEGYLLENLSGQTRRGRTPVPIRLNPDYGQIIGFDFEARHMRMIAADFAGQEIWRSEARLARPARRQQLIDRLMKFIDENLEEHQDQCPDILGMGVASPGLVDIDSGTLISYNMLDIATDIPLRKLISEKFQIPCTVENNIRAYTRAEWMSGAGRDFSSFVVMAVRSGVGAGIVLNNRLWEGSHGFAAEIGYGPVPGAGDSAKWLNLNDHVSEVALGIDSQRKPLKPEVAEHAGQIIGAQLATMASLLDPEAFILAGELLNPAGAIWPSLMRTYRRFLIPEAVDRIAVIPSQMGSFAAAIGATHGCYQSLFPGYMTSS